MPGTTRYSATFDRPYEEDAKPSSPPNARRSRSQSWQANSGHDGRQYTPFATRSPGPRSSSTDNNPNKGTEFIPTRTAKTSVKAHNNPFQFVKVGTCPLYKKAEEQLKKAKEVKKPDVLKEEEEEWQSNLDSWKSRRRKMSEDVFRRQEEIKLLELEEQIAQVSQKKTKTFSEMVESRATRGRALSLCLLTSPLEFQNWEFENKTHKNGSCSYTDESGENSTVNSEDEGVSVRGRHGEPSLNENEMNHNRTNGDAHTEQNGSKLDTQNGNCNKLTNDVQMKPKENSYIDSGLESISSSHRAGDTPDSGSDFSQDSNSSIDCDSPRTGVNVLEEFGSKSSQISEGHEIAIKLNLGEKGQDFGFTFLGGKDEGQVIIASILEGSKAESSGLHLGDRIITIDGCDVNSKKHIEIAALIQKGRERAHINLLLWRLAKSTNGTNGFSVEEKHNKVITEGNLNTKPYEKSIESENEMYVDDFEELKRQSELLANKKSDTVNINTQAQTNGNISPNKDIISLKTSTESSTAPILKINTSNSAVEEPDKNEKKTETNNENQKKNIIKVKRVRRKGVYALNVDSNHISQDGNSTNSLFPLSPVTELPSPADETKTVSSALCSNNTLPVSNSQTKITDEEKQKSAEIKSDIPVAQENNSILLTSAKVENSKPAALHTDLKNTENKIQLNSENKIETADANASLASKNKEIQEEKSKSQSTSKKVKSNKLKKVATSENTSAVSESVKEPSCAAKISDANSKTVIQEKSFLESKSTPTLDNKQSAIKNGVENIKASEATENSIISSENVSVTAAKEMVVIPIKTTESSNVVCNNTRIQSTKNVSNNVEIPASNRQPKTLTSEDNKPKKTVQKKVIVKPKANTTEKKSSVISTDATLNEIYSSKEQNSPSVIEKQEKVGSKNETTVPSPKEENISNGIDNISQEIKPSVTKDETSIPCPSTNKVRDLALKFGVKNSPESLLPAKNSKPVKISSSEKPKPVITAQKESLAAKENCIEQNVTSSSPAVSISSISNIFDSSSKNVSVPVKAKQVKMKMKDENTIASSKRGLSAEQVPIDNMQVTNKSTTSSVSSSAAPSSKKVVKGIQLKKENKATPVTQDEKTKTVVKNEIKVSPLTRVINFYKSHK